MLEVGQRGIAHRHITDLPGRLVPGSLVVVNDTRVMHARLLGRKTSGGKAEVLLVRRIEGDRWWAMVRTSRRVRANMDIELDGGLRATVVKAPNDEGLAEVTLEAAREACAVDEIVERVGQVPLPPYLGRDPEPSDRERYQTRFARRRGAVAAPTAGLHFSEALISAISSHCEIATVTLHVGPGTFKPVKVDELDDHPMHAEELEVSDTLVRQIAAARERGAPVVAVGTTVVRALETAATDEGHIRPLRGETRLLIQPGYRFNVVDALLTNFHLPGSTLLALVYAFGGRRRVADAYAEAVREAYRFYSYGDAMFLPSRAPVTAEQAT